LLASDTAMRATLSPHPRAQIYYWKCDRPAAFHGTSGHGDAAAIERALRPLLAARFDTSAVVLRPAAGQGNHLTFEAEIDGRAMFVRVEDGPEHDDYIEVESSVLGQVRALGVPAPRVHAVDASRVQVPFAWQVMDRIAQPDLNHWHKQGLLDLPHACKEIGAAVARWQTIEPAGFGPFNPIVLREEQRLAGFHARYEDYFRLHLETHLAFLEERGFISLEQTAGIEQAIGAHRELLQLDRACLVHKDLALWNILGSATEIAAYIDWDDTIAGDPMDDLSLLGCFHDGAALAAALCGYSSVRALPAQHGRRFWLHLLRNMVVKSVIRLGAGYFARGSSFFLIGAGGSGASLESFTRARLAAALRGLREYLPIESL
jgi:aminoglycoside phosphotransferase (APT) family kinase protein